MDMRKEYFKWIIRGYKDVKIGIPYLHAPTPTPPPLPTNLLPLEWQRYFDGWNAGLKDLINEL